MRELVSNSTCLLKMIWNFTTFHFGRVNVDLWRMTSSQKMMALPQIGLPGQPLAPSSSYKPGPGTHLPSSPSSSMIRASILGPTTVTTPSSKKGDLPTLSISRNQQTQSQQTQTTLLPKEGSIILGRITRINIREARVQILVINDIPTMEEFIGVIRYHNPSQHNTQHKNYIFKESGTLIVVFKMFVQRRKTELKYIPVLDLVILFVLKLYNPSPLFNGQRTDPDVDFIGRSTILLFKYCKEWIRCIIR